MWTEPPSKVHKKSPLHCGLPALFHLHRNLLSHELSKMVCAVPPALLSSLVPRGRLCGVAPLEQKYLHSSSAAASMQAPKNYILLSLFTLGEAICLAVQCSDMAEDVVLEALLITSGAVLGLCTYALTTEKDITYFGGLCNHPT